ncbi:MAG TPA: glycosyltransferase [Pyrinomonadaceae bacterium]|jgi:glycosyltransferase involved in cell wall biosynthesis|nr:glycosyltransferase [Pyrinomonadaceae bacterium]
MTKLAFLIRSLDYGGAERHLLTLARFLDKERFAVTVLYFYTGGRLEQELRESGVRLISLDKKSRWDLLGFLWRLTKQLRALRPDVLHSFLVEPNLLGVLLKPLLRGTKIIWGVRASVIDFANYDWFARLNFRLQSFFSRFADLIIFNSDAGRTHHLSEGFPAAKSLVIHNGIDTERFKPERVAGLRLRAELGISNEMVLIGHVARLDPVKDHPTFLKAAALLCRERDDVRFLMVGGGTEESVARLQTLTVELGIRERVIWAGARAQMTEVYNALDVFASSSTSEGFPNVIGEAMACGVPCVVTDVGDSSLIVGDTGIVVAPQSPDALARGLGSILESNVKELGERARERIAEKFAVARMIEETERAIKDGV